MKFRVEVDTGEGVWNTNALTYETQAEAEDAAASLFSRWTLVRQTRVVPVSTPLQEDIA